MLTLFAIAAFVTIVLITLAIFTLLVGVILFLFPRTRVFAPFIMLVPTLTALGAAGGSWGLGAFANAVVEPLFAGAPLFGFLLGFLVGALVGFALGCGLAVYIRRCFIPTHENAACHPVGEA